jgi:hypothetical protein
MRVTPQDLMLKTTEPLEPGLWNCV